MTIMLNRILKEIQVLSECLSEPEIRGIANAIVNVDHIFLSGKGRSGLMIQAFANRLVHLGFSASIIGEITTPHTHPNDLMIFSTASGETVALLEQAKEAKNANLKIIVITANSQSSICNYADICYLIPASSKISQNQSLQPMGSLFEQTSLLLFDALILSLMQITNQTNSDLQKKHANIE